MTLKKLMSAATLAFLLTTGVAVAQVTSPTTGTGTMTTTTVPGIPSTGTGGDMAENILLLGSSALVALAGILYLATRRTREM